jgi:3-methyladenine DNA glycosylase AlkD
MKSNIVSGIIQELEIQGDEKIRKSSQHFFKETIKFHGIKSSVVLRIGKEYFKKLRDKSKKEIFDLCDELWQTGYFEESIMACNWSYYRHKDFEPADLKIFEKWLHLYVSNWATCDTLCNHTIGTLLEMYPEFITELKKWAKSENRWMRRASAVSLIIPARKGKFLHDILEISDMLLTDKDDMVQKGYGWMLKAASEFHQKPVFEYVIGKKAIMPRTSLRYAIEKMPRELREQAMAK